MGNYDYLDGVEGTTTGLKETKNEYPGIGYHLTKGQLYLNSKKVDKIKVTAFDMGQWKNVTVGTRDQKRVIGSYHIKERAENMKQGDAKESRVQMVLQVDGDLYLMGSGSQNIYGAWLKRGEQDAQYYAKGLDKGFWYELQDHIALVRKETGKTIPQYGWEFEIYPSETELDTGYQMITPLKRGPFKFVGKEQFEANEKLYVSEELEAWAEKRSNPTGKVETSSEGTVETPAEPDYPQDFTPPVIEEETDEIPF